jgi:hypothetical protein
MSPRAKRARTRTATVRYRSYGVHSVAKPSSMKTLRPRLTPSGTTVSSSLRPRWSSRLIRFSMMSCCSATSRPAAVAPSTAVEIVIASVPVLRGRRRRRRAQLRQPALVAVTPPAVLGATL